MYTILRQNIRLKRIMFRFFSYRLTFFILFFFSILFICSFYLFNNIFFFDDQLQTNCNFDIVKNNKNPLGLTEQMLSCCEIEKVLFPSFKFNSYISNDKIFDTTIIFIGDSNARNFYWRTLDEIKHCIQPSSIDIEFRKRFSILFHNDTFIEDFNWPLKIPNTLAKLHVIYVVAKHLSQIPDILETIVEIISGKQKKVFSFFYTNLKKKYIYKFRLLISVYTGMWDIVRPEIKWDGHNYYYIDWLLPTPRLPLTEDPLFLPFHLQTYEERLIQFRDFLNKKLFKLKDIFENMEQSNLQGLKLVNSIFSNTKDDIPLFFPPEYHILFINPSRVNCSAERFALNRTNKIYKFILGISRCRQILYPAWSIVHNIINSTITNAMNEVCNSIGYCKTINFIDSDKYILKDNHVMLSDTLEKNSGICTIKDGVHFDTNNSYNLNECGSMIQREWWNSMTVK